MTISFSKDRSGNGRRLLHVSWRHKIYLTLINLIYLEPWGWWSAFKVEENTEDCIALLVSPWYWISSLQFGIFYYKKYLIICLLSFGKYLMHFKMRIYQMKRPCFVLVWCTEIDFIVLAHRYNSLQVGMPPFFGREIVETLLFVAIKLMNYKNLWFTQTPVFLHPLPWLGRGQLNCMNIVCHSFLYFIMSW